MRIKTVMLNNLTFRINYDPDLQVFFSPDWPGVQESSEAELLKKLGTPVVAVTYAQQIIHMIVADYGVQIEVGVIEQYEAGVPSFVREEHASTFVKPGSHLLPEFEGSLPYERAGGLMNSTQRVHGYYAYAPELATALKEWQLAHEGLVSDLLAIIDGATEIGAPINARAIMLKANAIGESRYR